MVNKAILFIHSISFCATNSLNYSFIISNKLNIFPTEMVDFESNIDAETNQTKIAVEDVDLQYGNLLLDQFSSPSYLPLDGHIE